MTTAIAKDQSTGSDSATILQGLAAIGAILLDEGGEHFTAYPAIARAVVEFDGYRGGGDILAIDLHPTGEDTRPIHPEIAAALLEEPLPESSALPATTVGRALEQAILGLLELRHPGWTDGEGSAGEIDIAWKPVPGGPPVVVIAGTLETRSVVKTEQPFWGSTGGQPGESRGKESA